MTTNAELMVLFAKRKRGNRTKSTRKIFTAVLTEALASVLTMASTLAFFAETFFAVKVKSRNFMPGDSRDIKFRDVERKRKEY